MDRRKFMKTAALAGASAAVLGKAPLTFKPASEPAATAGESKRPIVLSTWDFRIPVNETAYWAMQEGGSVLDAVEKSIRLVEEDPNITSVGRGGYPDRDGHLTLDACIMDQHGNAGSVACLEHIMHPVSVARLVMEKTPHVMLVGDGAEQFAVAQGFKRESLLTDAARKAYEEWLKTSNYTPTGGTRTHDTIGLVAMDASGAMAGGCSTSGLSWKMHGRVADSALIGAGLYVDNEVGGATATGVGETVIRIAGSFLIVELMRHGSSPQEACREAVERLIRKQPQYKNTGDFLVGFVAMNKDGDVGALSYRKGLQYSLHKDGANTVHDAEYLVN